MEAAARRARSSCYRAEDPSWVESGPSGGAADPVGRGEVVHAGHCATLGWRRCAPDPPVSSVSALRPVVVATGDPRRILRTPPRRATSRQALTYTRTQVAHFGNSVKIEWSAAVP